MLVITCLTLYSSIATMLWGSTARGQLALSHQVSWTRRESQESETKNICNLKCLTNRKVQFKCFSFYQLTSSLQQQCILQCFLSNLSLQLLVVQWKIQHYFDRWQSEVLTGCHCCGPRLGINDKHNPQPCILIIIYYFWQTCRHNDLLCRLSLIVCCLLAIATFCWLETMFIQLESNYNVSIKMMSSRKIEAEQKMSGGELCVKIGFNYQGFQPVAIFCF